MSRVSVELDWDTVDKIVTDALKQAYQDNTIGNRYVHPDDVPHMELMRDALKIVLRYYLNETDFNEWEKEIGDNEQEKE